jgi:hypothetical protein
MILVFPLCFDFDIIAFFEVEDFPDLFRNPDISITTITQGETNFLAVAFFLPFFVLSKIAVAVSSLKGSFIFKNSSISFASPFWARSEIRKHLNVTVVSP